MTEGIFCLDEAKNITERIRQDECPEDIQVKEPRSGRDAIAVAITRLFNEV